MSGPDLPALATLHARTLLRARQHERAAWRLSPEDQPRAEMERDDAAAARREAAALAMVLEPLGVLVPEPDQLSLFSDGGDRA